VSETFWAVIRVFNYIVLFYFVVLNLVYLCTSFFAFGALRRYSLRMKSLDLTDLITSAWAPPITLIAPAYNEEATCVESVRSLLTLEYPEYEILVVNDGSVDSTIERLTEAFNLQPASRVLTAELESAEVRQVLRSRRHPNLWVIDKENGGKADALNAGLNHCQTPLFCAMDADSLIEPEALIRIVRPFLEDADTVAAGGVLRIANGCVVKQGRVIDVRLPKNFLAQLQVLEYLRAFLSGRMGWDALDATLVISGAFGIFKRSVVLGYVSFAATVIAGRAEWPFVIAFLSVAVILGGALSLSAVALEELSFRRYPRLSDLLRLFSLALLENFGYRQLSAWWRLKGTISDIRGVEGWGHMVRKGFNVEDEEASV
jgi:cellulose synthase/poly-beta-1,6-N-acetylglucosamine synthase-like glycosyltransferase